MLYAFVLRAWHHLLRGDDLLHKHCQSLRFARSIGRWLLYLFRIGGRAKFSCGSSVLKREINESFECFSCSSGGLLLCGKNCRLRAFVGFFAQNSYRAAGLAGHVRNDARHVRIQVGSRPAFMCLLAVSDWGRWIRKLALQGLRS